MKINKILFGIIVLISSMVGCNSTKIVDVPLTSGMIPYQLPAGQYTDTKGIIHNEANIRWSMSEEDLYNSTRQIKTQPRLSKQDIITMICMVLIIVFWIILTDIRHYNSVKQQLKKIKEEHDLLKQKNKDRKD